MVYVFAIATSAGAAFFTHTHPNIGYVLTYIYPGTPAFGAQRRHRSDL